MPDPSISNFNNIISKIIKKSLFTERQIQIILNQAASEKIVFPISKGAYFRQVKQSREKVLGLLYSIILLKGIGVITQDDVDVITKLSEQVSVIQNSDIFLEKEEEIMYVIDEVINRACKV